MTCCAVAAAEFSRVPGLKVDSDTLTSVPTGKLVRRPPSQAFVVIAAGVTAISLAAIFIRLAQAEGIPSLFIAAARMSIATAVLTPIVLRKHSDEIRNQLAFRDVVWMGVAGVFLAAHFATWILSLEFTGVLVSVALVNTNPLWAAFIESAVLHQTQRRQVKLALLLGLAGSVIVALPASGPVVLGRSPIQGSALALIGAITVAVYFVIGKSLRGRHSLMVYVWMVYGTAALTLLVLVLIYRIPVTGYSTQGYLWLAAMALIPQLIGHTSLNYALKYLPATYVGITAQLEPVFSSAAAFLIFGEVPFLIHVMGTVIILSGVILATVAQARNT